MYTHTETCINHVYTYHDVFVLAITHISDTNSVLLSLDECCEQQHLQRMARKCFSQGSHLIWGKQLRSSVGMHCGAVGVTPRASECKESDGWQKQGIVLLFCSLHVHILCAYLAAHDCTCTEHLHQVYKSVRRYMYQHT